MPRRGSRRPRTGLGASRRRTRSTATELPIPGASKAVLVPTRAAFEVSVQVVGHIGLSARWTRTGEIRDISRDRPGLAEPQRVRNPGKGAILRTPLALPGQYSL